MVLSANILNNVLYFFTVFGLFLINLKTGKIIYERKERIDTVLVNHTETFYMIKEAGVLTFRFYHMENCQPFFTLYSSSIRDLAKFEIKHTCNGQYLVNLLDS